MDISTTLWLLGLVSALVVVLPLILGGIGALSALLIIPRAIIKLCRRGKKRRR